MRISNCLLLLKKILKLHCFMVIAALGFLENIGVFFTAKVVLKQKCQKTD